MAETSIEWTERVWNPVTGCSKVSAGCKHCYAETIANRRLPKGGFVDRPFTEVRTHADRLDQPLRWRKPRRIFVNSMSDLFHEDVADRFIDQVFAVVALAPQHTFQVLTKRADRMRRYFESVGFRQELIGIEAERISGFDRYDTSGVGHRWKLPLPNVWLGVSVENQRFADERIPLLLQTTAAVRFISAEPLLGPVDLNDVGDCISVVDTDAQRQIDWVIVGGESGPSARPFDVAWACSIVQQCKAAGVPAFVKQLGAVRFIACQQCGRRVGNVLSGFTDACGPAHRALIAEMQRIRNRKGGDMAEWPEDLRVREFPTATAEGRP